MNTKTIFLILVILYILYRNNKKEQFTCINNTENATLGTCSDMDNESDLINVNNNTLEVGSIGLTNTTSDKIGFIDISSDKITVQGSSLNDIITDSNKITVDKLILPEDSSLCFPNGECIDTTYNSVVFYKDKDSDDSGLTSFNTVNNKIIESSNLGDACLIYVQFITSTYSNIFKLSPGIQTFPSEFNLPRRFDIKPGYTIKCFISNNTLLTADGETENNLNYDNLYCEFRNTSDKTLVIYTSQIINYRNAINTYGLNKVMIYGKHVSYSEKTHTFAELTNYLFYRPVNLNMKTEITDGETVEKCYDDDGNELTDCNLNGGIMYDNLSEKPDNQYEYTITNLENNDDYMVIDVFGDNASDYITNDINELGTNDKYIYLNDALLLNFRPPIPLFSDKVPHLELIRTMEIIKL